MLIKPDKILLGDAILSPKEANVKQREIIRKQRQKDITPEQSLLVQKEMSLGSPLEWRELIRRLKLLVPDLIAMPGGYPNAIQLRILDKQRKEGEPETKYVGGFMKSTLAEYDTAELDEWGVAKKFNRGWRSVVQGLVQGGYATKAKADKIFGEAVGQRSVLWQQKTKEM